MARIQSLFFALIFSLICLVGCISERCGTCDAYMLITFTYELNNESVDRFETDVEQVTVFIFDEDGKYVDTYIESGEQLVNGWVMRIMLPEGEYSAVAYGGTLEGYNTGTLLEEEEALAELVIGESDISDFYIELESELDENEEFITAKAEISELYVGDATSITSTTGNQEVMIIELIKSTNDIVVTVSGTSSYEEDIETYLTANNGLYDSTHDSSTSFGTTIYTASAVDIDDDSSQHTITTMRLVTDSDTASSAPDARGGMGRILTRTTTDDHFKLSVDNAETGDEIYSDNIIDLILSSPDYNTQEDLDREDTYYVEVTISGGVVVGVSVNGWVINFVNPDW